MIRAPKQPHHVSETDRRNRYRVGKCGKYERTAETIGRQKEKLRLHWADPEVRRRHAEFTRARMAMPGVKERIAERTAAALADPAVKARHRAGLARAKVLRQLPRAERDAAMAGLASAADGGAK
jgi:hypothetical protein